MTFNSIEFLLFSILFFLLWPLFRPRDNARWGFIVVFSFFFYGWWDWRFLFLILFSGLIDYIAGILLVKAPRYKKTTLFISLCTNLGSLFVFKYSVFFGNILGSFFSWFGIEYDFVGQIPEFALVLPVGISFYTFQSMSYTIDIYRNRLKPTKNILHFFAYLAMFPQLVAGPIVRAIDLLKQLTSYRIPNNLEKWNAIKLICFGLFQKVVIADNLSYMIDSAYENKSMFDGTLFWWIIAIAFSFQIYCDFSGYSLIARGIAKYMGYHFKMNFNHPYLSTSLRMFWQRWHISLSTWFRDYVYIPLGGSRNGVSRSLLALTITMLLSGLWHGANYTFIIWALLHILFLILERYTAWIKNIRYPVILILIVFAQVTIAWVYFRASNIEQANEIIKKLFLPMSSDMQFFNFYMDSLFFLLVGILIEAMIYLKRINKSIMIIYRTYHLDVIVVSIAIVMIIFLRGEGKQFIYFQF